MENNTVKISVIMPVYKVERYLKRAIESVLNSSFGDFELYLVDDGSPDKSGQICDEYAKKDARIKVIHQKNQGAHIARNNALKEAKGKYVCFFDSDDYIDKNMLRDLYDMMEKSNLDLSVCGFYIETYYNNIDYFTLDYIPTSYTYLDKDEFRRESYKYFDINMFYPPWNKMYRMSYLKEHNIMFPITYRDDFPFVLDVIKDIEKVGFTDKEYYHFIRKREDSETQKYVPTLYEKRNEEHEKMIDLYRHWGLQSDEKSKDMIARRYIDRIIECMVNLYNKECILEENEKLKEIKRYINNKYTEDAIKIAKPKKFYLKLMYLPIKLNSAKQCQLMAKCINNVKSKNIMLFSKLKKNR